MSYTLTPVHISRRRDAMTYWSSLCIYTSFHIPQPIYITVSEDNHTLLFRMKSTTRLNKPMRVYCELRGLNRNFVRFLFNGEKVKPEDTPQKAIGHGRPENLGGAPRSDWWMSEA
ncbi:hypothetical protein ACJ73_01787 [Blastomyces percursus]|uniref:Rad60/SUMO-like domain-containing protein n=1 Tax=Blastomyces percursus TaxID=1658174 RepID=A0A1J9RFP1_9EURO|nr:hypothetical protein ACJ73_01787 [Blastomyces percursus]